MVEIKTEKIGEVSLVGPLQESTCLAKMLTKRHILCELHVDRTFISSTMLVNIGFSQKQS